MIPDRNPLYAWVSVRDHGMRHGDQPGERSLPVRSAALALF